MEPVGEGEDMVKESKPAERTSLAEVTFLMGVVTLLDDIFSGARMVFFWCTGDIFWCGMEVF